MMRKSTKNQKNQGIFDVYNNWQHSRKILSSEIYKSLLSGKDFLETWWLFECDNELKTDKFVFTKFLIISFLQDLRLKRKINNFTYSEKIFYDFNFLELYVTFNKDNFKKWYENEFTNTENVDYKGDFFSSKAIIQKEFLKKGNKNRPSAGELKVLAYAIANKNKPIKYISVVKYYGSDLSELEAKGKTEKRRAIEIISRIRSKLKSPYKFTPIENVGWILNK